ncbi:CSC1-like protein At1g69450 [Chenopodium quinoa]|uniref:CSC1-like protein At1g69450 n=1 Tax=Chenopodium quinoa TaxID=63459 RepID=UPI000B78413E|nr:CSC1-like protein At1g69450 [Chenopodium quinoa]XP_021739988.1 CSC1-like protein At1g69450 [Chenopodium quinoa]
MIVSALLTSVGINSALCILFFALYSILRKQPGYLYVYVPRLLAAKGIERNRLIRLKRLLPSPGWVKIAWKLTEEELLSTTGLDAVVFIRIIILCLKIFTFAGIIGLFILLPINCSGTQLAAFDITVISNETLDLFTISNVNNGSKWLWAHCSAVYLMTGFVCYLLYHEYDYICSKRNAYFYASKPQPHQFTILVRGIPVTPGSSVSESVNNFFKDYHPTTYLSHVVIHRTNKLFYLINFVKKMYRRLTHKQSESAKEYSRHNGSFGLHKSDREQKLGDLEENLRAEQSDDASGQEVRSAFVFFRSRFGAAIASRLQQSEKPTEWVTEQAPEPNDVYWPFFQSTFLHRWMSRVVIIITSILLTVLFLIPVVLVQSLANLSQLEVWFPFLKDFLTAKMVRQVVTGYLPNLILQIFVKLVPPVMEFLSSIQGHISYSEIQRSASDKFLWFIVWNIFFANVLSGSFFNLFAVLLDLKNIPSHLAVSVPAQASFFIAYVVTSGWTSTTADLFRIIQLIQSLFQKCCCCNRTHSNEFDLPYIYYHREIPKILFFGLLGITYFFLAPLILPFLLVYFLLAYVIFKNQFIHVYAPKFETAGRFWPTVHNCMIFSLVLMHAIALGIFTVKKLSSASSLIFPLPVLTLLFNEYCRKRFLPNFSIYSAETLIKKDREDLSDPQMPRFFTELITAYMDPALSPLQCSNSDCHSVPSFSDISNDHITPLLSLD